VAALNAAIPSLQQAVAATISTARPLHSLISPDFTLDTKSSALTYRHPPIFLGSSAEALSAVSFARQRSRESRRET
jgi:hypothetical protein